MLIKVVNNNNNNNIYIDCMVQFLSSFDAEQNGERIMEIG